MLLGLGIAPMRGQWRLWRRKRHAIGTTSPIAYSSKELLRTWPRTRMSAGTATSMGAPHASPWLCPQSASTKEGGGDFQVDKDGGQNVQAAHPEHTARRLPIPPHCGGLQLGPHGEAAARERMSRGDMGARALRCPAFLLRQGGCRAHP